MPQRSAPSTFTVLEKDESGHISSIHIQGSGRGQYHIELKAHSDIHHTQRTPSQQAQFVVFSALSRLNRLFADLFLPVGYPLSVTPDYLPYQVYNALQAFCGSISGLLASRGALEAVGVGNASASATQALLLTVVKDVFSRLVTISAAYYLGTSLYPETKTFRFLADIVNDISIVLDTLVPDIGAIELNKWIPFTPGGPTLQILALCSSGCLRSLCQLTAAGSKAALTNHFATPSGGGGDVGELNAKDASRETVIGLTGTLLGTLLVSYANTRASTYILLSFLVVAHLLFNYLAVRSVILRTLNRQRTCILWTTYRARGTERKTLEPVEVALKERILVNPNQLRDAHSGRILGYCLLGTSIRTAISHCSPEHVASALRVFEQERYTLFVEERSIGFPRRPVIFACFKDDYKPIDQLHAWVQALEIARHFEEQRACHRNAVVDAEILHSTYLAVQGTVQAFLDSLAKAGWETGETSMMFRPPSNLTLRFDCTEESKKER